ncbi:MAG: TatD family hydrolase [Scytonema sp. PMC 1069.18]|nr:TatD family hydrolase [Scytonema sp. PMC 1069.18]MEC4880899.1 TatD family hydrolase [Scytonema sp. PMC 1070.18]
MQLIDTHVHINFDVFQPDIEDVRERWQAAGVVRLVHSCVEPSEFSSIQYLAKRFPEISCAVGMHPLDAYKWNSKTGEEIVSMARSGSQVVAIGETGLDFYKAEDNEQQLKVFEAQLEISTELNLPVIIHCRDAASTLRDVLQKWKSIKGDRVRGVMHCWGGNPEETQWFLDLGFYISFSGTVTFKNAKQIQASAAMVSSDRLLIETDCPFLAPVPKRGSRRNEPSYVRFVAEHIARLRGETVEMIASLTTNNACKLFGLVL